MPKSPAEYARWVRQVHEIDAANPDPIDLVELVRRCGGDVNEIDLDGCAGLILRDGQYWGILLRASDSHRRRRFTLAHELGHFCIPSHERAAISCVSPEIIRGDGPKSTEREANEFAVELLMPRRVITPTLGHGAINLHRSTALSDQFDVSTVSATLRLSELTKEPTAVVYFERGLVRWSVRHGFPYGLGGSGDAPAVGTVAYDVAGGGTGSVDGEEVEPAAWLPLGRAQSDSSVVVESSIALGEDAGILTLLWLTETD